ncbi:MAG: efflux RND transporter periplasmic adaptor subunit [Planctomycetota bacterium]
MKNWMGQAPLVFVVFSIAILWATGGVHFGAAPAHDEPAVDPHAGHDHGPAEDKDDHADCEDDHGAEPDDHADCEDDHGAPPVDLGAAAKAPCEHGVATIDCDDCRFGLGLVKLDEGVEKSLLKTARVEARDATRAIPLTGQVQFDRTRTVDVPAPAGGRLLEIAVDLGDRVAAGDLLAILHSGEIAQARADHLRTLTACEIAREEQARQAGVTEALAALLEQITAKDGRSLEDEHAEDTEPPADDGAYIGEWKSKLLSSAARLRVAEIRHERELELEKKGISARAEHEEAHEVWESAKADFAAMVEEVKLTIHVEKLKADNGLKQACAAVTAAEQRLRVFGVSQEELDAFAGGETGEDYARLEIRAPRAGTVTALDTSAGRIVAGGENLFTVADLTELWVWVDLYARDLGTVTKSLAGGKPVPSRLTVTSFPGETFRGSLDYLGAELDPHTRTVKARIRVSNPDLRLKSGMFADVVLEIPGNRQVKVLPRRAVLTDGGQAFVFVRWQGDMWLRRDIRVVDLFGDHVSFDGDLRVGQTIAVEGAFMLKSDVLREQMGAG